MGHQKNLKLMKKSVIITDFDGTLVDTFFANYKSYKTAFELCGLSLDIDTYRKCFGLRFNEFMKYVGIDDVSTQTKIKAFKAGEYAKNIDFVKVNQYLVSFLMLAKNNGVKIGIGTTASKVNVQNVLNYFKLENLFDFIITGEDVTHGKPDPEVYIKALDAASFNPNYTITPEAALVFEDSDIGVQAAINAGIDYIKINKF